MISSVNRTWNSTNRTPRLVPNKYYKNYILFWLNAGESSCRSFSLWWKVERKASWSNLRDSFCFFLSNLLFPFNDLELYFTLAKLIFFFLTGLMDTEEAKESKLKMTNVLSFFEAFGKYFNLFFFFLRAFCWYFLAWNFPGATWWHS